MTNKFFHHNKVGLFYTEQLRLNDSLKITFHYEIFKYEEDIIYKILKISWHNITLVI